MLSSVMLSSKGRNSIFAVLYVGRFMIVQSSRGVLQVVLMMDRKASASSSVMVHGAWRMALLLSTVVLTAVFGMALMRGSTWHAVVIALTSPWWRSVVVAMMQVEAFEP